MGKLKQDDLAGCSDLGVRDASPTLLPASRPSSWRMLTDPNPTANSPCPPPDPRLLRPSIHVKCAFSIHGPSEFFTCSMLPRLSKGTTFQARTLFLFPAPAILLFSLLVTSHLGPSRNAHPGGRAKACWKVLRPASPHTPPEMSKEIGEKVMSGLRT